MFNGLNTTGDFDQYGIAGLGQDESGDFSQYSLRGVDFGQDFTKEYPDIEPKTLEGEEYIMNNYIDDEMGIMPENVLGNPITPEGMSGYHNQTGLLPEGMSGYQQMGQAHQTGADQQLGGNPITPQGLGSPMDDVVNHLQKSFMVPGVGVEVPMWVLYAGGAGLVWWIWNNKGIGAFEL